MNGDPPSEARRVCLLRPNSAHRNGSAEPAHGETSAGSAGADAGRAPLDEHLEVNPDEATECWHCTSQWRASGWRCWRCSADSGDAARPSTIGGLSSSHGEQNGHTHGWSWNDYWDDEDTWDGDDWWDEEDLFDDDADDSMDGSWDDEWSDEAIDTSGPRGSGWEEDSADRWWRSNYWCPPTPACPPAVCPPTPGGPCTTCPPTPWTPSAAPFTPGFLCRPLPMTPGGFVACGTPMGRGSIGPATPRGAMPGTPRSLGRALPATPFHILPGTPPCHFGPIRGWAAPSTPPVLRAPGTPLEAHMTAASLVARRGTRRTSPF